ncbi:MAG TPA: Ig-like domain repeat protein, partial [Rhodanobacteraceae bacterium]|nr:Ig-like domain repeat protein [Rhodanobacteraceae bacterium]
NRGVLKSLEFFDPVSGKSTPGPRLLEARSGHSAIALADGRVLLTGGRNGDNALLASSEIYDASGASLNPGASMGHARANHTSTLLADGRVLIAGGDAEGAAEIYDPATDHFVDAGRLAVARSGHSSVRLGDGRVLLVGGYDAAGATAEIFDPKTNTFSAVRGGLKTARVQPALKLISDGKVQVYGGDAEITMEVYNPAGYFSSRGHLLRDSNAFRSIMYSPGQAALIAIPSAKSKHYAEDALGPAAGEFERTAHTATEVAARSTMVVVGGFGATGAALDTITELGSCGGTVTTDLTDYYPGQTVVMSGSGWNPGENITLNLHRDTNDPPDTVLYATADENGEWINAEYVVQEFDANVTFVLTATGDSSCVAQTTFTDSVTSVVINSPTHTSPVTVTSLPATVHVNFTYSTVGTPTPPATTTATVSLSGGLPDVGPVTIPGGNNLTTTIDVVIPAGTPNASYNLKVNVNNNAGTTSPNGNATENNSIIVNVPAIAATATSVASSKNPSTFGDGVTFTSTVTSGGNPVTTGTVTFWDGSTCAVPSTSLGSSAVDASGHAAVSTSTLSVGQHTITACYGGTASFAASSGNTSQIVNTATTTALASSLNPSTFGSSVTFTATVNAGASLVTTGSVTFIEGGTCASPTATLAGPTALNGSGQAAFSTSSVAVGSHTVVACYGGSSGAPNFLAASNGSVTQVVNTATTTSLGSSLNPSTWGANVDFTATVLKAGTPVTTGSVTFIEGGTCASPTTTLAGPTALNAGGQAVLSTSSLSVGSHTVLACYGGSSGAPNFLAASSGSVVQVVNQATPTVKATGGTFDYNGNPRAGSCTVTGVGSDDLGTLAPTYTPPAAGTSTAPTDAGSYTVHCDFAGNTNYSAKSDTAPLTINKVDPIVKAFGGTFNYDTTQHAGSCTVTGVGGTSIASLSPTYTPPAAGTSTAPTDAGSYTVHCDYAESTNYNAKSDTASLTINKVDPIVTAFGGTFNYDTTQHAGSCTVTGVAGTPLGSLSPTYTPPAAGTSTAPTDAGSYTVHCDYAESTNYNAKSNTAPLTINKVDPIVTAFGGTFNYDTTQHAGSCTVTGVSGTPLGSLSPTYTPPPAGTPIAPTDAGSYTVHCDYAESTNYNAKSNTAPLTINKIDPTVTATGGTFNYDTSQHAGSCMVKGFGGVDLGSLSPTYTPPPGGTSIAPTDAGSYTVHCDYAESTNYNAKSDTASLTISKIDPTVTATGGTFNYDTSQHAGSCTVKGFGGVDLGSLSPTYTPPPAGTPIAPTDAGSYTVHCDYAATTNYNAKSDIAPLTINKIDPTVTATGGTFNYDTSQHAGSCTVKGFGGVDLGSLSPTYTPPPAGTPIAPTDAGNYTVHCDYAATTNYNAKSNTAALIIYRINPTVTAAGGTFNYDTNQHAGSCTVKGFGGVDLGSLSPTYTPPAAGTSIAPTDAGGYTVHCDYAGSTNYKPASNTAPLTINRVMPIVTANAGASPYTYNGLAHAGSCAVTGVGGVGLGSLAPTYTPDPTPAAAPTNAGNYIVHCDYPGSTNYLPASNTASLTINKAQLTVTANNISKPFGDPIVLTYTISGFVNGETIEHTIPVPVSGAPNCTTTATQWTPISPPTYPITCTLGTLAATNYTFTFVGGTLTITSRSALVNYIGQQMFVTSGSSSTTAQVTLSASVQDPSGLGLSGAKVDFIDCSTTCPGKTLASGVPVSPVQNSLFTGTANTIVTLSSGQYGSQSYQIYVRMTGNYDNDKQPLADKTATVVVMQPVATLETIAGGMFPHLSTAAGVYAGNNDAVSFSTGLSYTNKGTNLKGQISLTIPQADGFVSIKSNSLSSMAITGSGTGQSATVYAKASMYEVLNNGSTVAIDGNVTLRMDIVETGPGSPASPALVGFTVLSSKDSSLYYSNNWQSVPASGDTCGATCQNVWKTVVEGVSNGTVTIN